MQTLAEQRGSVYSRLGRRREPVVCHEILESRIGKAVQLHDGQDETLIATDGMLGVVARAAGTLAGRTVSAR